MYRIFNMKARKVCCWCFTNNTHKKFLNPKYIMNRKKPEVIKSESMTHQEIYDWYESLCRYMNKPDADEYMVI